ncbi:hypothetical protein [Aliidiomarina quisquiliarum]|uniref:hypothetical protein n=1 Tax=Aliidiomarina quisquiliarum TaxID=2938947 RepID=UPI00208E7DC1|nr:hypothetical protein [Aliidiomarina quisquiliarum]MCO4320995.1 hypothetical protein [Aliidiomarina quisquiliarum]
MVTVRVLSRFKDEPPTDWIDDKDRIIPFGPLYPAEEVAKLVADSHAIRAVTKKCRNDMQNLEIDNEALAQLIIKAIKTGRYRNSVWCRIKNKTIAACDSYVVFEKAWVEAAAKELESEYYLKFALNDAGKLLLVVSCHLS